MASHKHPRITFEVIRDSLVVVVDVVTVVALVQYPESALDLNAIVKLRV